MGIDPGTNYMGYGIIEIDGKNVRSVVMGDIDLPNLPEGREYALRTIKENIIRLETDMQRQESFMGAFAHELKTPMTAIIGYADLLRQDGLPEDTRLTAADYIYSEGQRLEKLSFKLLDLLLLDARKCKVSAALYGHTHISRISYEDGLYIVNPGSVSRSRNGPNSYAVIDITEKGIMPIIITI